MPEFRDQTFVGVSWEGGVLRGADLRGSRFVGCNLRGCDLEGADLRGALFDGADLRQADLSGARLEGATFLDTRWENASAVGARGRGALFAHPLPAALAEALDVEDGEQQPRAALLALGEALRTLTLDRPAEEARPAVARALELAPGWGRALATLAEIEERSRRIGDAVDAWERACAARPADSIFRRRYAQALVEAGEAERAVPLLEALCADRPDVPSRLRELGWAALHASRLDVARTALERAEQLLRRRGTVDVDLWLQLASVDVHQGRPRAALARFREALDAAPARIDLWRPLGELCEHLGTGEAAWGAYGHYLEGFPDDRSIWLRRAKLSASLGDAASAVDALDRATALDASAATADDQALVEELGALRPSLLDEAFRFEALAAATRPAAEDGDPAAGRLHTRALLGLDDARLGAWVARVAAQPGLDEDGLAELSLRAGLLDGTARRSPSDRPSRETSAAPSTLPATWVEDLRAAHLLDGEVRSIAIASDGALRLDLEGGALLKLYLGPGQRARAVDQTVPLRLAGHPAWASRAHGSAPPPADSPSLLESARRRAAGDDALLVALPFASRTRFTSAAHAAHMRARSLDAAAAALAGDPPWLQPLLDVLPDEAQRESIERYRGYRPDAAALARLHAMLAPRELLESAAVLWLLGPLADDASLLLESEPLLGSPMRALRQATVDLLQLRLDAVARAIFFLIVGR